MAVKTEIMIGLGILFIGLIRAQQTTDAQTNTGQPMNDMGPMATQLTANSDSSDLGPSFIKLQPLTPSTNTPSVGFQDAMNPAYVAINTPGTSYNMAPGNQNANMDPKSDLLLLMLPLLQSFGNKKSGGEGGGEGKEGGQEPKRGAKNKNMLLNVIMMQLLGNQSLNLDLLKRLMHKKRTRASQEQGSPKGEKMISLLDLVNLMRINKAGMNGNAGMMSGMMAGGMKDGTTSPDKPAVNPAKDMAFDQLGGGSDTNLLFDTLSTTDFGGGMGGQAAIESSQEVGEGMGMSGNGQTRIGDMFLGMLFGQGMPTELGGNMAGAGIEMGNAMLAMLMKQQINKRRGHAMSDSMEQAGAGFFGAAMSGGEGAEILGLSQAGSGDAQTRGEGKKGGSRKEKLRNLMILSLLRDQMATLNGSTQKGYGMFGQSGSMNDLALAMLLGGKIGKITKGGEGGEGANMGTLPEGEGAAEGSKEKSKSSSRREKLRKVLMMSLLQDQLPNSRFPMGVFGSSQLNANTGMGLMTDDIQSQMFARLMSRMRHGRNEEARTGGEGRLEAGEGIYRDVFGKTQDQKGTAGESQAHGGLSETMGQQEGGGGEGVQKNLFRFWSGQGSMSAFRQIRSGEGMADTENSGGTTGSCPRYPYTLMGNTLLFPYVGRNCKLTVKLRFPDVSVGESEGITGVSAQEMSQMSSISGGEEGETGNKCPTWRLWRVGKYATFIETVPGRCQIVIYAARSNRRGVNVDQVRVNFVNSSVSRSRGTEDFGQWSREGFKRLMAVQSQTQTQGMSSARIPTTPQPQTTTVADDQPAIRF